MWQPAAEHQSSEDWIESTARLPIAFAQVREDPLVDLALVERLGRPARVLMIASGGETAALLSTLPLRELHLADMNAAQMNLTRLKLHLLKTADQEERLRLLGHQTMSAEERSHLLTARLAALNLPADSLGPLELVSRYGPDHCGRYEWLFARLRERLRPQAEAMDRLMRLREPAQQSELVTPETDLGKAIEAAFAETMDLSALVQIFGSEATANRAKPFATHFVDQTRDALSSFSAADNPFLHQIFLGKFLGPRWPWLDSERQDVLPKTMYSAIKMDQLLKSLPDNSYDLIHLSNILDWITPTEALGVLQNAFRCLASESLVVIRQLNSLVEIPALRCGFDWMPELAAQLHESDRSFFYRSLHIGMKR